MKNTLFEVYKNALKKLDNPERDEASIRMLLIENNHLADMSSFYLHKNEDIQDLRLFSLQFARFLRGEPIEYIVKWAFFMGQKFYVDSRCLIPRNETEEVVKYTIKKIKELFGKNKVKIADICAGSGVIGITLKQEFQDAEVSLSDIDKNALEVAKINCKNFNFPLKIHQENALNYYVKNDEKLDVIIANPPYVIDRKIIENSSLKYEPFKALFTDENLSVYNDILRDASKLKNGTQLIVFEIDPTITQKLKELVKKYIPQGKIEVIKDINGLERILSIINK